MVVLTAMMMIMTPLFAGNTDQTPKTDAKSATSKTQTKTDSSPATGEAKKSSPTPTVNPEEARMNQRIVDNIRATLGVPPSIEMNVLSRTPSKINGLDKVTVEVRNGADSNKQEVLVSSDNKFVLIARIIDVSDNPFAQNMRKINFSNAPSRGNKDAKVTIVEYSDFECPFCGQAYKTVENDVLKQYGDKVRIVYKNFPLASHPWAESAAVAGLCASQQNNDAFWSFYKGFFENQSSISPDNIKARSLELATTAKLDTKKFEECYDSKQTLPQIKAEMDEAQGLGITGTPLFVVNGHMLPGVQPFSAFQRVIDEELKRASN